MKIFVTGVNGQLGYDVVKELEKRGHEGIGSDVRDCIRDCAENAVGGSTKDNGYCNEEKSFGVKTRDVHPCCKETGGLEEKRDGSSRQKAAASMKYVRLDITDRAAVEQAISEICPDAVIHCAAWTAVDLAEEEENAEQVWAVNAEGTKYIAEVCKKLGCKMLYLSTDYVFDGQGSKPWEADCKEYRPLNVYGRTKLEGELAVSRTMEHYFIIRTAWAFGQNGNNFIRTMINVGQKQRSVRVVSDQVGTPTYTPDLARLLVDMAETEKYGYYHATNEGGYISWYEFCREIYRQYGLDTEVIPVTTEEYGLSKAARPKNSRMDKSKLSKAGFMPLPTWQDAVGRYLKSF